MMSGQVEPVRVRIGVRSGAGGAEERRSTRAGVLGVVIVLFGEVVFAGGQDQAAELGQGGRLGFGQRVAEAFAQRSGLVVEAEVPGECRGGLELDVGGAVGGVEAELVDYGSGDERQRRVDLGGGVEGGHGSSFRVCAGTVDLICTDVLLTSGCGGSEPLVVAAGTPSVTPACAGAGFVTSPAYAGPLSPRSAGGEGSSLGGVGVRRGWGALFSGFLGLLSDDLVDRAVEDEDVEFALVVGGERDDSIVEF